MIKVSLVKLINNLLYLASASSYFNKGKFIFVIYPSIDPFVNIYTLSFKSHDREMFKYYLIIINALFYIP